jgi:hypothetical protein
MTLFVYDKDYEENQILKTRNKGDNSGDFVARKNKMLERIFFSMHLFRMSSNDEIEETEKKIKTLGNVVEELDKAIPFFKTVKELKQKGEDEYEKFISM